jgi:flagellar biogenesis protein FliO
MGESSLDNLKFAFSILFSLAAIVFVIFLAYWTSRYLARHYSSLAQGKYMRILDRIVIGQNQCLILLETAGQVLLLGVTGQSVENLGQMKTADLQEIKNPPPAGDFAEALSEVIRNKFSTWRDRDPGEDGRH